MTTPITQQYPRRHWPPDPAGQHRRPPDVPRVIATDSQVETIAQQLAYAEAVARQWPSYLLEEMDPTWANLYRSIARLALNACDPVLVESAVFSSGVARPALNRLLRRLEAPGIVAAG